MIDRLRIALKVLFTPKILFITKNETFSTFNNSNAISTNKRITVDIDLTKN